MGGHNWRNTLGDFAGISGVLAGFCFSLIVFILGSSLGDTRFPCGSIWEQVTIPCGATWGQVAVLVAGVSSALFVASAEFFLTAKAYDVWSIPKELGDALRGGFADKNQDWDKIGEYSDKMCELYLERGRRCYNIGIFVIFGAVWFIVSPYNIIISSIVYLTGTGLEVYQVLTRPKLEDIWRKTSQGKRIEREKSN